jgi:putative SOS response-associated peptidase YedK
MALAGLWEKWRSPAGECVRSFAIITTKPNELCGEIHNRLPAFLKGDVAGVAWRGTRGRRPAEGMLGPYSSEAMTCWPVSPRVGSIKNNDRSLLDPIAVAAG